VSKDEDIGFDFSKVTKFFIRRKKSGASHETEEQVEDRRKIVSVLALIALLLIPMAVSVYIRMLPSTIPATDDWARTSVYNMIKTNIRTTLDAQYPNLPEKNKATIVEQEFEKILKQGTISLQGQETSIDQTVKDYSTYFKAQLQSPSGDAYLGNLDSYYWYRLTRNVVRNGSEFEMRDANGIYYDTKILAGGPHPVGGDKAVTNLHVYIEYLIYKVVRVFDSEEDLMHVVAYSTVIIAVLAVIPAFFIARKIGGNIGGFFAGLLIAIHPVFIARSDFGNGDTDPYAIFFPLLIIWLLIEAFERRNLIWATVLGAASGLAVGLFAFAWSGWLFAFYMAIGIGAAAIGYYAIVYHREFIRKPRETFGKIRNTVVALGAFILSSGVFVSALTNVDQFTQSFRGLLGFTQIKAVAVDKIWPNVYTTVAEMNPASLSTTISQISMGTKLWLFIGLIGIVVPLLVFRRKYAWYFAGGSGLWYLIVIILQGSMTSQAFYGFLLSVPVIAWIIYAVIDREHIDIKYSVMLLIWYVATIYAASKGVRFVMLVVPAFALGAGITIGAVTKSLSEWISRELKVQKAITTTVIVALFIALLFWPVNFVAAGVSTAKNDIPMMNDAWYDSLTKIKDEAAPDAIINSWWDFGHWFAAIAERPVSLDGGRQNNPVAHWLGNLMLTWDENESVGILRYIDCGSNTGFDKLYDYMGNDSLAAIDTVYEIIVVDRPAAQRILEQKGLSAAQAVDVLQFTHCTPPEDYFITSEDMVGKSGVWAHFGGWNFTKSVMYNQVYKKERSEGVKILTDRFGLNASEAGTVYNEIQNVDPDQWISPWPSYAGSESGCTIAANLIQCSNGVIFDTDSEDAYVNTQGGRMNLHAFSFVDKKGVFRTKIYDTNYVTAQNGRPLGATLIKQGSTYTSVLMDYELTGSMFTRLFYHDAYGLSHFDEFTRAREITGGEIIVWKVNWPGRTLNVSVSPEQTKPGAAGNASVRNDTGVLMKADHIFISSANRTDAAAKQLIYEISANLSDSNFDDMVGRFSDCGDGTIPCSLGWFGSSSGLPAAFTEVARGLGIGEVSQPFKTGLGYHIIRLTARKE
jgi:dolichyl-phosphooligosaccharide-protein glycotransferase